MICTYIIRLLDVIVQGRHMGLCKTIFRLKKSHRQKIIRPLDVIV